MLILAQSLCRAFATLQTKLEARLTFCMLTSQNLDGLCPESTLLLCQYCPSAFIRVSSWANEARSRCTTCSKLWLILGTPEGEISHLHKSQRNSPKLCPITKDRSREKGHSHDKDVRGSESSTGLRQHQRGVH